MYNVCSKQPYATRGTNGLAQQVSGKAGRKEEEEVWKQIIKQGQGICDHLTKLCGPANCLLSQFQDKFGQPRENRAESRNCRKNKKMCQKRTVRAQ